jgi:hypothetical protein
VGRREREREDGVRRGREAKDPIWDNMTHMYLRTDEVQSLNGYFINS